MSTSPKYVGTPAEFSAAVHLGVTPESEVLEFKREIDRWSLPDGAPKHVKREAQKESCRDIAQFANSRGGCLLVGVEWTTINGVRVATSAKPVSEPDRLQQWIEQAIKNFVVPSTFSRQVVAVSLPEGTILSVNVPPSVHLVSLWDEESHAIEYPYRTSHGKAWMNPDEAERHLMNGARATKLSFDAVSEAARENRKKQAGPFTVNVAGGFWLWNSSSGAFSPIQRWTPKEVRLVAVLSESFELRVDTFRLTLPYGVVQEVWLGADESFNLLLSVRPILRDQTLTIEPFG